MEVRPRTRVIRIFPHEASLLRLNTALAIQQNDKWRVQKWFLRPIALNPRYATAHHWYGVMLLRQGRLAESRGPIERARALDPLSPVIAALHAVMFYLGRDYDGATERLVQVVRRCSSRSTVSGPAEAHGIEALARTRCVSIAHPADTAGVSTA